MTLNSENRYDITKMAENIRNILKIRAVSSNGTATRAR
jgi:hypothetical protein